MENQEKTTDTSSRALIYLRSAERNQAAINRQEEDCLRLLGQRNHTHAASIEDNGCSGIGWKARPGFVRALEMCEEGAVDVLICTCLDRLSRDAGELLEILARLKRAGTGLETVAEEDVFAQPDIVHRYEMLALAFQSADTPGRASHGRKGSKSRQGPAHSAPQASLPLFDE